MAEYVVKGAEPNETVLHVAWTPNGYESWQWLPVREEIVRCRDCEHGHITIDGESCKWCDLIATHDIDGNESNNGYNPEPYFEADFFLRMGQEKGEQMSITDELRTYVGNFYLFRYKDVREKLDAIADRIDVEHERQTADARAEGIAEGIDADFEAREHHGWIRLPNDADGVPIRVGDVMEAHGRGTVTCIRDAGHGWEIVIDHVYCYNPDDLRHYHKPTVEDVLWKLLGAIRPDMEDDEAVPIVAAYAKRLRLADGEDA